MLVQVPVEVASFLLNGASVRDHQIELKQRISVLLVPNKSLDTPNYKLDRLKTTIRVSIRWMPAVGRRNRRCGDLHPPGSQERSNKQEPLISVLPDGLAL